MAAPKGATLATALAGGDASNQPIVHPIRWAGSVHRKKTPVLAQIVSETDNEIDLGDALEILRDAVAASGISRKKSENGDKAQTETGESRDTARLIAQILKAEDYHTALTALAMRYLLGGMADAQAVLTLRGVMQAVPQELRDNGLQGRWQARYDDIPRAVSTARAKIVHPAAASGRKIQATAQSGKNH